MFLLYFGSVQKRTHIYSCLVLCFGSFRKKKLMNRKLIKGSMTSYKCYEETRMNLRQIRLGPEHLSRKTILKDIKF